MASRKQQYLSNLIDAIHGGESIEPDAKDQQVRLQETADNLTARIEEIRTHVWKRPYPIIFDSELITTDTNPDSEFHDSLTAAKRKAMFDKLIKTGKIKLADKGPRISRNEGNGRLMLIGLKSTPMS